MSMSSSGDSRYLQEEVSLHLSRGQALDVNTSYVHSSAKEDLNALIDFFDVVLQPDDRAPLSAGDHRAAAVARRIIDVCREDAAALMANEVPIAVSIGVAQWTPEISGFPDRLIAAADHALYVAKKEGKNRYSVYETSPPLVPEAPAAAAPTPRTPTD